MDESNPAGVVGSGLAIMSLSSMRANPSIEEPSNPIASPRASSSSDEVMVKLLRNPRISVNHN